MAVGMGLILDGGTKIPQAAGHDRKKKSHRWKREERPAGGYQTVMQQLLAATGLRTGTNLCRDIIDEEFELLYPQKWSHILPDT